MTKAGSGGGFQDWATLRNHLIDKYGSTPHPSAEQEIIDAYKLHPDQVTKAALDLIHQTGITSRWGVLKSRAARIATPPSNPTRPASQDREKRIARAEQWIRNAGVHYDRHTEVDDELFGDRGLLHDYANEEPLRTRLHTLWQTLRPLGLAAENEAITRAETWKQQQRALAAKAQAAAAAENDLPF